MIRSRLAYLGLLAALITSPAFAETGSPAAANAAADAAQEQQIKQGLQSGELSTREAAKLEKGEQIIDRTEAKALRSGDVSEQEAARIENMQSHQENRIDRLDSNAVKGNPDSASSKRMQHDVQRNINQEKRIEEGVDSGKLTNREAGKLERGQAHAERKEWRAGRDGHVGPGEQARIRKTENRQNRHIMHKKHNARVNPAATAPAAGNAAGGAQ